MVGLDPFVVPQDIARSLGHARPSHRHAHLFGPCRRDQPRFHSCRRVAKGGQAAIGHTISVLGRALDLINSSSRGAQEDVVVAEEETLSPALSGATGA